MDLKTKFFLDGWVSLSLPREPLIEIKTILSRAQLYDRADSGVWMKTYNDGYDLIGSLRQEIAMGVQQLLTYLLPEAQASAGTELALGTFTARCVDPTRRSYMDLHRDTYFRDGFLVGRSPPLKKVLIYPELFSDARPVLAVVNGSHKMHFKTRLLDKVYGRLSRKTIIKESDRTTLFMDSSAIHGVIPVVDRSSWRVILNFCERSQMNTFSTDYTSGCGERN